MNTPEVFYLKEKITPLLIRKIEVVKLSAYEELREKFNLLQLRLDLQADPRAQFVVTQYSSLDKEAKDKIDKLMEVLKSIKEHVPQ